MKVYLERRLSNAFEDIAPIRRFDIAVAFIESSGVKILERLLNEEYDVRVLTSFNPGFIDPKALRDLMDMEIDIKIYVNRRFHPKVYLVHKAKGLKNETMAVVGSANLSSAGLVENVEANLVIRGPQNLNLLKEIKRYFEDYWNSPFAKSPDENILRRLEKAWNRYKRIEKKIHTSIKVNIKSQLLNDIKRGVYDRRFWLTITSPENYKKCVERNLWGAEREVRKISKIKPGDLIVFYVKCEKELRDVYEVASSCFEDRSKVWHDKIYPYRILIRPILKDVSLDVKNIIEKLSFIKNPEKWGAYLQREMILLENTKDIRILFRKLKLEL